MSFHHVSGIVLPAWTDEELDERYDEIVKAHPDGLNYRQWRTIALQSARHDDVLHPHPVGDFWIRNSLMMKLMFEGYAERRCHWNKPGHWYITRVGKEFVKAHPTASPGDAREGKP